MISTPVVNRVLRSLIQRNLVTFPSQMPHFHRRGSRELSHRIAQLFFLRGWSVKAISRRYGISKAAVQKRLNEWRIRAVESGYIQEIEPGCMGGSSEPPIAGERTSHKPAESHHLFSDVQPSSGATARFRITQESLGTHRSKPCDEISETLPCPKVLILCSDSRFRYSLMRAFLEFGFEASEASTGEEVLALCRVIRYDAVLLDLIATGRRGIEICSELRASDLQMAILMLSDNEDQERNIDALEAGADDYATRPYHIGEIVVRVRAAFRHSRTLGHSALNLSPAVLSDLHSCSQLIVTPDAARLDSDASWVLNSAERFLPLAHAGNNYGATAPTLLGRLTRDRIMRDLCSLTSAAR